MKNKRPAAEDGSKPEDVASLGRFAKSKIETLDVDKIHASPFNPRHPLTAATWEGLTESVKRHGVMVPIVVHRTNDESRPFAVLCGSRRVAAAEIAGLRQVPAIVCPDDTPEAELRAIGIADNAIRLDVPILEQAVAVADLVAMSGEAVASELLGKPLGWVRRAKRLVALAKPWQDALRDGRLDEETAHMLGRISLSRQKAIAEHYAAADPLEIAEIRLRVNVAEVFLGVAPFALDAEGLNGKAPACINCTKNTGTEPELFDIFAGQPACLGPECYAAKARRAAEQFVNLMNADIDEETHETTVRLHALTDRIIIVPRGDELDDASERPEARIIPDVSGEPLRSCPNTIHGVVVDAIPDRIQEIGTKRHALCRGERCRTHRRGPAVDVGARTQEIRRRQLIGHVCRQDVLLTLPASQATEHFARVVLDPLPKTMLIRLAKALGVGGDESPERMRAKLAKMDVRAMVALSLLKEAGTDELLTKAARAAGMSSVDVSKMLLGEAEIPEE